MTSDQPARPKLRIVGSDEDSHQAESDQLRDDMLVKAHRRFRQRADQFLDDTPPPAA